MKQSLPGIADIAYIPCRNLSPHIIEKHRSGIPVAVFSTPTPIEHYGNASCDAESEYINGGYFEKTELKFTTTDDIPNSSGIAFVVTDVQNNSYLIGCKEAPYPTVEITKSIKEDSNIREVKVSFTRQKSLVPCVI